MNSLNFTLKQHTPIIHFQHQQGSATLRGTEVKPKLDRFLIKECELVEEVIIDGKVIKLPKEKYKNLFINEGKQHLALDYKLSFENISFTEKYYLSSFPYSSKKQSALEGIVLSEFDAKYVHETQYFANNENLKPGEIINKDKVKLGFLQDTIQGKIVTYNSELLDFIFKKIEAFFLVENFGSRQSKGFGCYTVSSVDGKSFTFDENKLLEQFDVVYKNTSKLKNIILALQEISSIYMLLKSGRGANSKQGYKKSLLFRYFVSLSNPVRWEKRMLKQNIKKSYFKFKNNAGAYEDIELKYKNDPCYNNSNNMNWNDIPTTYIYQYIRALLGLAESYEFATNDIDRNSFKYYIKVKSNNGIERFKSPITVKYINGAIYFCANDIDSGILNSVQNPVSFNFDKRLKKGNSLQNSHNFETQDFVRNLETPNMFNIGDFLDFAFNRDSEKISDMTILKNSLLK